MLTARQTVKFGELSPHTAQGIFKEILELHKRGGMGNGGTEVPQRGPGAEPR